LGEEYQILITHNSSLHCGAMPSVATLSSLVQEFVGLTKENDTYLITVCE
jgi:hypothetical protein